MRSKVPVRAQFLQSEASSSSFLPAVTVLHVFLQKHSECLEVEDELLLAVFWIPEPYDFINRNYHEKQQTWRQIGAVVLFVALPGNRTLFFFFFLHVCVCVSTYAKKGGRNC